MRKKLIIFLFLICASQLVINNTAAAKADAGSETVIENAAQIQQTPPDKKTLNEIEKYHKQTLKKMEKLRRAEEKAAAKAQKSASKKSKSKNKNKNKNNSSAALQQANPGQAVSAGISEVRIMQLDECIQTALAHHPAVQSALADTEIIKSRIVQAWAAYFPVLTAGISYSRNDAQASSITPQVERYNMFYTPTISANMLLFDFGKTKAEADSLKRGYEASKYNLASAVNNVIYNVKQSYYNLLFAARQVQVYEDTVKDYELHLEQAKAYYDIGRKPKIDVLAAEYNLGNAKLNLLQARNTQHTALAALSSAMGMSEYSDYDIMDNVSADEYSIAMAEALKAAYETNPQLLAAKKKAEASEVYVKASKRAFLPDISAFASYTNGGTSPGKDYGYQFGAQIAYQAVNLLQTKKQVDEASAQYKKDSADYQNVRQNIYYQVKQAYLNMQTAWESINAARLLAAQAKEQYDSASGRYKAGLGDAVELKDAETTYRNAQLNFYNTILNYNVSAANLECLIGVPLNTLDSALL